MKNYQFKELLAGIGRDTGAVAENIYVNKVEVIQPRRPVATNEILSFTINEPLLLQGFNRNVMSLISQKRQDVLGRAISL